MSFKVITERPRLYLKRKEKYPADIRIADQVNSHHMGDVRIEFLTLIESFLWPIYMYVWVPKHGAEWMNWHGMVWLLNFRVGALYSESHSEATGFAFIMR